MKKNKDYSILLNKVYLWILQHPDEKVIYTRLARELGMTRQTASIEHHKITNFENIYNIKNFYEEENNIYVRAIKIIKDIDKRIYSIPQYAKLLRISTDTLYKYVPKEILEEDDLEDITHVPNSGVYFIRFKNEIIYIGATIDFDSRFLQHKRSIDAKKDDTKLYSYCKENNIHFNDLEFIKVIFEDNGAKRHEHERNLIRVLKPICNEIF